MKFKNTILPAIALGAAAVMTLPAQEVAGWSLLGFTLPLSQRDCRVYNNFADSTANNNNTPDPAFPGYQGVFMSQWKAYVEWGSTLHGDGSGDPHQAGGLGSGGANFDPTWQGTATGIGGINDNIISAVGSCSSGVLAYTESPWNDGWRIRFCDNAWVWDDGPGFHNNWDLQGVGCHELGHALGLGHSAVPGSTMYASIGQSGSEQPRSIETDDSNGVKAAYGTAGGGKVTITSVTPSGSQVTITGTNFSASNNEVWFTQAGQGGNGVPIKVTGVTSNGTSITVTVPAAAGPGDVLVKNSGGGHANLSNAWPSDLQGGPPCSDPTNYCVTSPNSVGAGMVIGFSGSASVGLQDFTLLAFGGPPNQFGIFYYGPEQVQIPFGEGYRCVGGGATGIFRLPVATIDSFGDVSHEIQWDQPPVNGGPGAWFSGVTWNCQFWYRDPAGGGTGFNLTDALQVDLCE